MQQWANIDKELEKKLANYKYGYYEVVKIVGFTEKTLQRYLNEGIVSPIKVSNERLFTNEQIKKLKFVYELKKRLYTDIATGAGLYDYFKKIGHEPNIDIIQELSETYFH